MSFIFKDNKEAEKYLAYWQKELNLLDWEIVISIVRERDFIEPAQADVTYKPDKKTAIIKLCDPIDYDNPCFTQDHERSLVHELIHISMCLFDSHYKDSDLMEILHEQHVDRLAKTLVTLRRRAGDYIV